MIYGVGGSVRLSDIVNGQLGAGTVPLARQTRAQGSGRNLGIVTVTAANTEVVPPSGPACKVGDVIYAWGNARITKGGTAGQTTLAIDLSGGTGTFLAFDTLTRVAQTIPSMPAGSVADIAVSCAFRCTANGTPGVRLRANSIGSDGSIAADDGQLYFIVFVGITA